MAFSLMSLLLLHVGFSLLTSDSYSVLMQITKLGCFFFFSSVSGFSSVLFWPAWLSLYSLQQSRVGALMYAFPIGVLQAWKGRKCGMAGLAPSFSSSGLSSDWNGKHLLPAFHLAFGLFTMRVSAVLDHIATWMEAEVLAFSCFVLSLCWRFHTYKRRKFRMKQSKPRAFHVLRYNKVTIYNNLEMIHVKINFKN